MSNRQIHVNREGQIYGPLQESTAHEMLESGQLLATDLAWFAGAAEWKPLREVLGPTPTVSAAAFSQNTVTSEPDIRPIPDFGAFIKEYEELEKYRTASPLNNIEGGEQQNQKLASLISRCRGYLQDLVRYAGENQQNREVLQYAHQRIAQYMECYETYVLVDGTKLNPVFGNRDGYFRDKVLNPAFVQKGEIEKLLDQQQTADGSGRPGTKKYPIKAVLIWALLVK